MRTGLIAMDNVNASISEKVFLIRQYFRGVMTP